MNDSEQRTYGRLLDKSKEAFLLAVELYNRPTIRYHVEGCAFFLCNAWELMLKAYLIKRDGERAIYFKDKEDRTISLQKCMALVMTNDADPVRRNLERVIDLRNTSTHFVTDEYELFYGPIFQVCVKNFDDKMRSLHGVEMCEVIPESYLVLSVKRDIIDPEAIRTKYPREVAQKLLELNNEILVGAGEDGDVRYAGLYQTNFILTKDAKKADLSVRIAKDGESPIAVLRQVQDVQDKYPYTCKLALNAINAKLKRKGITIWYKGTERESLNMSQWLLFVKFYEMKGEERFAHNRNLPEESPCYVYSQQSIDLVVDECSRDPEHVIDRLDCELKKKKADPRSKGF